MIKSIRTKNFDLITDFPDEMTSQDEQCMKDYIETAVTHCIKRDLNVISFYFRSSDEGYWFTEAILRERTHTSNCGYYYLDDTKFSRGGEGKLMMWQNKQP